MKSFSCNNSYEDYLKEYEERILEKQGLSSPASEREIICLAEEGNTVCCKHYADLIFYKKILRKNYYRDAFKLYLKSAGIEVSEDGIWISRPDAYPLSYWVIGYYLVNYRRETALAKCEKIDIIERMTLEDRMLTALTLASACLDYIDSAGAVNLIGRILYEVAEDDKLYERLRDDISDLLTGRKFEKSGISVELLSSKRDFKEIAEGFFVKAAEEGYIYACNSLAAREAEKIVKMSKNAGENAGADAEGGAENDVADSIMNYICFLKLAADRFEPYAANRLGLFYMTGEISAAGEKVRFKEYMDRDLAKQYFVKATHYPDNNSAWGYFNLMKYFYNDYQNDIELMNEHMDYIKELNPEVYYLAMDL